MPSIGVCIKLNQIQTRTNLGHRPQWKKWRQIQNLFGILLKLFGKAKLNDLYCEKNDEMVKGGINK